MIQKTGKNTDKYTVITGASSGIGYEAAKAFAERGKNLVITARRKNNLEMLRQEILERHPDLSEHTTQADRWRGSCLNCTTVKTWWGW